MLVIRVGYYKGIQKKAEPFVACPNSGYRQVTSHTHKHRTAHAIEREPSIYLFPVCENWRYSSWENKSKSSNPKCTINEN